MALKKLKCNVCGNNQFGLRYALKNFNVVKCKNCGLIFRDIILTEQEINQLYSKNYFPDSKKILAGQIKYFKNKLNEINKITEKRKLLDIGCSTGTFMQVAEDDGWEVYGFDISKDALSVCRTKGLAVYENFADIPKFDVITVLNMIDHLENPQEFLREVISRLNNNGILVLCTSTIDKRLIYIFAPWYILNQLKLRQGSCGDCTCCDKKILWFKCKYFEDGKCSVYKTKKMPTLCWAYPIDKKDIWGKDKCKLWE